MPLNCTNKIHKGKRQLPQCYFQSALCAAKHSSCYVIERVCNQQRCHSLTINFSYNFQLNMEIFFLRVKRTNLDDANDDNDDDDDRPFGERTTAIESPKKDVRLNRRITPQHFTNSIYPLFL